MPESWFKRASRRWKEKHHGRVPVDRGGNLLSSNKIAGPSWDVPIAATCAPTAVCAQSCYALNPSKPITWSAAVNRQHVRLSQATSDPDETAARIASEVTRRKLGHLAINGSGDLTDEMVEVVNQLAPLIDPVPIWVRSRKPKQAAQLNPHPNVFLHFSLDRDSLHRRGRFLSLSPRVQHFFSYQGAKGEVIDESHGCALVFGDRYDGSLLGTDLRPLARCPLHDLCDPSRPRESATGACGSCRRCFDGTLVREQKSLDFRDNSV